MWSDPSMNMAYGNQWMNPALYKNMTNEQVDWASLAQQWIKMKETPPAMPPGQQNRPAAASCEPNLIRPTQPVDRQNSQGATAPNKALGDHNVPVPNTGNTIEKPSAWNSWTWQQQQQWNWNWASSPTAPPVKTVNPVRPPYVAPPILSEPPPSFPMISTQTNKPFPANHFWAGPNTRVPPPEPDQWNNKQPNILNVEDRSQDLSFIDAAKRKQLPAWIREGLEKMEREKRRKMEREQSFDESDYSNLNNESVSNDMHKSPNNFDNETQMADNSPDHNDFESRKADFVKDESPPLIPRKTKAQIWEDTMFSLRQTLTKLLMDVTNDMMLSVVKEVVKTTAQTDIQGNQSQTSLAGKLGLGDYGSESGSSDESDEEQQTPSHKQSLKPDSDEAIQERIIKRQREFNNIEARILMELDQLEDREKLVRSKFDSSVKLSGDNNDNGSQVVENIQTKGRVEDEGSSQKLDKGHDKSKKELSNVTNSKNGQKKKKSKYKRSSSSSGLSSSSDSKKSDDSDGKYCYKKNDKVKSKSSNKRSKNDGVKRKRRSRSRNRSRSYSRTKRSRSRSRNKSRSRSRHRSRSHSRHYDRRSPHSYRSRRSRSPASRHGSSRKYKSKRNSSSSSNESRSIKHRYRR